MVKFISYNGKYPNLCSGELVIEIDGKECNLGKYVLRSGGSVSFTDDWDEVVTDGAWSVDVPEELQKYKEEIEEVVNDNVPWGCCGGCV